MMNSDAFKGANVFMSRNLVPPEIFDTLHDALKNNGAKVFLCCDPSRNSSNDYHVISSMDHEKFEDLRAKGCNLLGPQCVLSCSMEHRALPQQCFTCCLAMDGVKVLASGFQGDEKAKIERLVTAMGGVLHVKASLDVSFVIVNSVLAAKYKWALNILKKPIVTIDWLYQCWNEHRIVPHKSYGVLPFSGLTISVTRVPADERKEIEKLIMNNGGKYSADLTKKCTHLICTAPEGDKYKVARTWGHINIVARKWFDQSIARKACLNEESYQVLSSNKVVGGCLVSRHTQGKVRSQSEASTFVAESKISAVSCSGFADSDLEATLSQNKSKFFESSPRNREGCDEVPNTLPKNVQIDSCVADDSQSEDGDLYLSACRISLVGFEAPEMRKLVNMVRSGGGSRYMLLNDKLTHIVVGTPSEMEKKEVRDIAASGVIHVVCTTWLEDCDYKKKEIPVIRRHMAFDKLIPKDSNKGAGMGMTSLNQSKPSVGVNISSNQESMSLRVGVSSMEKKVDEQLQINTSVESTDGATTKMSNQSRAPGIDGINKGQPAMQRDFTVQHGISSRVFKGKIFQFSTSFPDDRRAEIEQWVTQGGGIVVDDHVMHNVHFRIECHGAIPKRAEVHQLTYVSSHWIRSCLEDGHLLDVRRHILYSPLPCSIPLLGLEKCRFCVSQYEDKDRILLRNLCFVLGAKFVEKLTKKVTHLVCKFASGPKYEAARKWGIHSITSEWICECVRQNKVVSMDSYRPKEVTAQDHEGGFCTTSQFPTQAVRMISGDGSSQFPSQHQDLKDSPMEIENVSYRRDDKESSFSNKKARLLEDSQSCLIPSAKNPTNYVSIVNEAKDNASKSSIEVNAPDVASAIEDLLEQTSKIRDQKSPKPGSSDKSIFAPECSILGQDHSDSHSVIGLSKHWLNRTERKDGAKNSSGDGSAGLYDGFSETQTDSQVVGYEEDLSGRQMLIDRVRTRSSMI